MELTDQHRYDAPVGTVLDMFGNPDAVRTRYEGMGHRDVEVLECVRGDDAVRVRSRRVVDVDLPGFARKVLSPTNTMVQTDEWRPVAGGAWEGTFDVDVQGAPVKLGGTMRLTPEGDSACTHTVTLRMDVKVPLVGGKIADWVGKNDARTTLAAEFAAGDAWLADHPA